MSSEPQKADANAEAEPPKKKKAAWRLKLEALVAEYGTAAFVTWFGIFGLTWLGFILAISFGFEVDSGGEGTGVVLVAYFATQLTKPIRIGATVVLTPVVVKVWHRFFPPKPQDEEEDDDDEDDDDDDDEDDDEEEEEQPARVK
jgi:hypothetical protein